MSEPRQEYIARGYGMSRIKSSYECATVSFRGRKASVGGPLARFSHGRGGQGGS
jgi:hypothetical protein